MNHLNKKKEKQQKLHDNLINILYPPPSPHTQFDDQTLDFAREIVDSGHHHQINTTDEFEEENNKRGELESSENEEEEGFRKLTRAQRKRLRKKKLKETGGLKRRPIIGPVLPGDDKLDNDQHPEGVRRNASEKPESRNDREKPTSCIKVKQRRMSKKMATDKPTTSHEATSYGDQR
uniref:uncharacterized protein LOC122606103 n=1 Tax=Erigeron canadensis TaxID=72917 RepID=UPI001CB8D31E|nr:uncharacterized protein LOC122606103 [Erigeron canadensis]